MVHGEWVAQFFFPLIAKNTNRNILYKGHAVSAERCQEVLMATLQTSALLFFSDQRKKKYKSNRDSRRFAGKKQNNQKSRPDGSLCLTQRCNIFM